MTLDTLLAISHLLTKDEYHHMQHFFPHMSVLAETNFNHVVERVQNNSYKFIVFLSCEDTLPPTWRIDTLRVESPVMILLNINQADFCVIQSLMDAVGLISKPTSPPEQREVHPMLHKSLEFIEENLCENDLSLEKVAASIFVSRCHYSRIFKTYIGVGFKEFIMNKRIEKAKLMLQEGTSVTEVCYAVGYGDLTHFGRVFKRMVGINPSEYLRNRKSLSS